MAIIRNLSIVLMSVTVLGMNQPAQAQQGPVATACAADMEKVCAGKTHVRREMRNCLEANKDKVSAACKTALDTTGPGKGGGKGMGGGMGRGPGAGMAN